MTKEFNYPDSYPQDLSETLHEVEVPDPYRWLEDLDSPQTQAWIAAQNELTLDDLSGIPARETIRRRMTELWDYEKFGLPSKRGGRYFYTRQTGLQNQAVLYWQDTLDAEPRLLLDPNTLTADGTVALVDYTISEDGSLLAYGLSKSGSDWQDWYVLEVDTGRQLSDHVAWVKFSNTSWTHDNSGFFYSSYDEPAAGETYKSTLHYQKLYYHRLGTSQAEDQLIYARADQKNWGFSGSVTRDGRYLLIYVWVGTNRENGLFYVDLEKVDWQVVPLLDQFYATYQPIGSEGATLFILTDDNAPNNRLVAVDLKSPTKENWQVLIPEEVQALELVTYLGGRFVARYLQDAHSRVQIYDRTGDSGPEIELPGLGSVSGFHGSQDDPETFFHFTSFTTPGGIYRYDLEKGTTEIFRAPVLKFNPDDYLTTQVFYDSYDGTRVPMFITHKRGLTPSPESPVYLYGYGGFNISMVPAFSVSILILLEMGIIFAQPNLRGGGEYGKHWHEGGMKFQKQNVFDDFSAAAEWLIANRYTNRDKLAIGGGSNGGLLVAACMVQRPDLFAVCLPNVGVLDMLRFHKFTIGWGWASDYGSPENPEEFKALHAYSPYHNLKKGTRYPATLITTADHDDRVYPAHSFKFAAALQAAHQGDNPVFIRVETKAGHGLGKPTAKVIEQTADRWAFLLKNLGLA